MKKLSRVLFSGVLFLGLYYIVRAQEAREISADRVRNEMPGLIDSSNRRVIGEVDTQPNGMPVTDTVDQDQMNITAVQSEDALDQEAQRTTSRPVEPTRVAPERRQARPEREATTQVGQAAGQGVQPGANLSREHDQEMPEILRQAEQGFDFEAKRKSTIRLVEDGINFFLKSSLDESFNAFSHSQEFKRGELYIFVYDLEGNCFAHGQDEHLIWKNLYNLKDDYNIPIVQNIIKAAQNDIGWVTYQWRGATKKSYVKEVVKDDKSYILGAGYYPHSKAEAVVSLVIGAVSHFNEIVYTYGGPPSEAFSDFSYPLGRFVQGDLYLYAMDFDGNHTAHGERPGLIGSNALNYQDANGKFVNKAIISKLKETSGGVWVEYVSKNAPKVAYAREVVDKQGKRFFIACGYYPSADRTQVTALVKRAYEFMKKHGLGSAVDEFTDRRNNNYRFGDLYVFVYDMKGNVIANGSNPELVGLNRWNEKDENGVYYVRELVRRAQDGGGWVNYRVKNSFESAYIEPIDLGLEEYLIGSSLFPISKQETMLLLVRSGSEYLRTHNRMQALSQFTTSGSNFIRGDLFLSVYDPTGIVLAYGNEYDLIWRNLINAQDDFGKQYVRLIINSVQHGPAKVTYTINGVKRVVYTEQVSNEGFTYVISSGYFL